MKQQPDLTQKLVLAATALFAMAAHAQVDVVFIPASRGELYAADTYRSIWQDFGERIVAALEARTCMPFAEPVVWAHVDEAVSNSGGPDHPMRLRASYNRNVKASTLVHELGHRHLWQLAERLDGIDSHMTLYLILDRVWADVWGDEFARQRIDGESGWDADYENAWAWAQSLSVDRRTALWNRLLKMNGYSGYCYGPLTERHATARTESIRTNGARGSHTSTPTLGRVTATR